MAVSDWSTTAASNVLATTGVNFDEGQTPGSVNNSARELMAQLRTYFDTLEASIAAKQTSDATLTALAALTITATTWIKGTGTDTFAVENASTTCTSLGLGTIATQNANSVTITGGTISVSSVSGG